MNIFNTKKVRMEWERRIEESYEEGKKAAVDEALASVNKAMEDKKEWNKLSEKELMVEIMSTLNIYNTRLEHLNDKINYISNFHTIFNELDNRIQDLKDCEQTLYKSIEKSEEKVAEFEENTNKIITKTEKLDNTLEKTMEIKNKIENIICDFKKIIPNLKDACIQIDNIASNMNNQIEQYVDSPMTILNELKTKMENMQNSIEDVQNELSNLDEIVENELDEGDYDSLYYKLDDIKSTIDSALDKYGFDSLYSKLDNIKNEINSKYSN